MEEKMKNKGLIVFCVALMLLLCLPLPKIVLPILYLVMVAGFISVISMTMIIKTKAKGLRIYPAFVTYWMLFSVAVMFAMVKGILNDEKFQTFTKIQEFFITIVSKNIIYLCLLILLMVSIIGCLILYIVKKNHASEEDNKTEEARKKTETETETVNDSLKVLNGSAEAGIFIWLVQTISYFVIHYGKLHEELLKVTIESLSISASFAFGFLSLMLLSIIMFRWAVKSWKEIN